MSTIIEQQDYELDYSFLSGGERTAIALAYRAGSDAETAPDGAAMAAEAEFNRLMDGEYEFEDFVPVYADLADEAVKRGIYPMRAET